MSDLLPLTLEEKQYLRDSVLHVYGCLGGLNEIPFDLKNHESTIIKESYKRIKLIDDRNRIHLPIDKTDKYKKVHFIGFGYDEINMSIINTKQFTSASFKGTAYYYSPEQIQELKAKYNIDAYNLTCKEYVTNMTT